MQIFSSALIVKLRYYSYYSVINILISYKYVWIGQSGLGSVREVTQSLASCSEI